MWRLSILVVLPELLESFIVLSTGVGKGGVSFCSTVVNIPTVGHDYCRMRDAAIIPPGYPATRSPCGLFGATADDL